jgi:O-antigen/teichoic acid export membrane protein
MAGLVEQIFCYNKFVVDHMEHIFNFLKSKTVYDIQWAFLSLLSSGILFIILRIIIGRELGVTAFGIYTLAFTVYQFGLQFANFGIGAALTKYIAESSNNDGVIQKYLSSGIVCSIFSGLLFGIILFILSPFIAHSVFNIPELEPLFKITAVCYPFISIQFAISGTFNGMRRMKTFALLNMSQNFLIILFSVFFVMICNLSIFGAVLGYAIPTCLVGGLSPLLINGTNWITKAAIEIAVIKKITAFGFFFALSTSSSFLNIYLGTLLIGYFLNPAEVGIFAVAITLSQALTILPSAIQRVTTPAIASAYANKGNRETRKLIISSMKYPFLVVLALGIILIATGPWLISFFFSESYSSAYQPLIFLTIGNIIFTPVIATGACFFSMGKISLPYKVNLLNIVLTIGLNIVLIPFLGIMGAALATVSMQILLLIIHLKLIWIYTEENNPLRHTIK